jgi:hypothetical protein
MLPPSLTSTRAVLAPVLVLATQLGVAPVESEVRPAAHLSVKSSAGCASRSDVIARVLSRAPNVRFVDGAAALDIQVHVDARQANLVTSEVTLSGGGTPPFTRRVVAASCTEASEAIAVIIAIALGKSTSRDRDSTAAERAATAAPNGTTATTDRRDDTAATEAASRENSRENAESAESAENSERSATDGLRSLESEPRFALQLAGQSFVAPAPGVMIGLGIYAMVGLDTASLWSPALVLGVTRAWRSSVEARGGTASFTLDAAMLDACAVRFALAAIETRLCVWALGGSLTAEGTNTLNAPGAVARPFWAVGGTVMFSAAIGARFEMTARLAAGVNLVRDEFKFDPIVFHEVAAVTFAPSIGFGARFP